MRLQSYPLTAQSEESTTSQTALTIMMEPPQLERFESSKTANQNVYDGGKMPQGNDTSPAVIAPGPDDVECDTQVGSDRFLCISFNHVGRTYRCRLCLTCLWASLIIKRWTLFCSNGCT